jgi:putative nucleotidyltransferase with HDIG domain
MAETLTIPIDQLQVGLYVHLDLKWFEHPFAFNQFKIKNADQLEALQGLGLSHIRYSPALSDVAPAAAPVRAPVEKPAAPADSPMLAAKRAMMERIRKQRQDAARIEQAFAKSTEAIRGIERNLFSQPEESMRLAGQLVDQITDSFLTMPELAIHVMGDKLGGEEVYLHSLNVTILSMMIARDIKLPRELAAVLGLGALLHDVGLKNIPDRVVNKTDALNRAEQALLETHCDGGLAIAHKLGMPAAAAAIVRDHHELYDGSGYPRGLKGEAIGALSRIVMIANYYDELCNPPSLADALTPHEALALMFAKLRARFDPKLLQVFIRCLGVYPPGTVIQLSNGVLGMVVSVNTQMPTRPIVMAYQADVPPEQAILVDLAHETDLNIARCIKPVQLPKDVYQYLSPRRRVSYYFDAGEQAARRSQP